MTADGLSDYRRLPLPIRARVVELMRRVGDWPRLVEPSRFAERGKDVSDCGRAIGE
jgi:hypothetical protein